MLFKAGDMLILASSIDEARIIFNSENKTSIDIPISCLINDNHRFCYIDSSILSMSGIESKFSKCLSNIKLSYKDSSKSVQSILVHIDLLTEDKLNILFNSLVDSEFNETKSIFLLFKNIKESTKFKHMITEWYNKLNLHISRYWIKYNYNGEWTVGPLCNELMIYMPDFSLKQYEESEENMEYLQNCTKRNKMIKIMNSVNFSYETIESVSDQIKNVWILKHYDFKQNLVRDGQIIISINENRFKHNTLSVL